MKAATKGLRAERVAMAREREREFERHGHMVSTRMKHATVSVHSAPHPYRRSAAAAHLFDLTNGPSRLALLAIWQMIAPPNFLPPPPLLVSFSKGGDAADDHNRPFRAASRCECGKASGGPSGR